MCSIRSQTAWRTFGCPHYIRCHAPNYLLMNNTFGQLGRPSLFYMLTPALDYGFE